MGHEEIQALAESYSPQERQSLLGLAAEYRRRDEREVLELGALAADVSADDVFNLGLDESNPQLVEAFGMQYPNVPIESLRGASEQRLTGLAQGVKGKYFEVLAKDPERWRECWQAVIRAWTGGSPGRISDPAGLGRGDREPRRDAGRAPSTQGYRIHELRQDGA